MALPWLIGGAVAYGAKKLYDAYSEEVEKERRQREREEEAQAREDREQARREQQAEEHKKKKEFIKMEFISQSQSIGKNVAANLPKAIIKTYGKNGFDENYDADCVLDGKYSIEFYRKKIVENYYFIKMFDVLIEVLPDSKNAEETIDNMAFFCGYYNPKFDFQSLESVHETIHQIDEKISTLSDFQKKLEELKKVVE